MVEQILSNNNERCYSNFSTTFHYLNTPQIKIFRSGVLVVVVGREKVKCALQVMCPYALCVGRSEPSSGGG
jgi:hypothetical protein